MIRFCESEDRHRLHPQRPGEVPTENNLRQANSVVVLSLAQGDSTTGGHLLPPTLMVSGIESDSNRTFTELPDNVNMIFFTRQSEWICKCSGLLSLPERRHAGVCPPPRRTGREREPKLYLGWCGNPIAPGPGFRQSRYVNGRR